MLFPLCVLAPFAYFFPKIALFYAICGAYDVSRNSGLKLSTLRRYFIGNGFLLWLLSPINIVLDLFALPYVNKGVYRLDDLPPDYQDEVRRLLRVTDDADLVRRLEERSQDHRRTMFSWRWYGINRSRGGCSRLRRTVEIRQDNRIVRLQQKDHHVAPFGWLRPTLRLLYNINDMKDKSAYIVVGNETSYWCNNKLFIFDDTLLHLSANETDQPRYCMFVDILRPTLFPRVMAAVVAFEAFLNGNSSSSGSAAGPWSGDNARAPTTRDRLTPAMRGGSKGVAIIPV